MFCSPDVSIFYVSLLSNVFCVQNAGRKFTFGKMTLSIWKSKKYIYPTCHCPATSTDDEFIKKAITEFWYKDNSLCLRVFSNCSYFIAGCMLKSNILFPPLLPFFKNCFFDPFVSGNRKIVSVAHLASMLCYIYSRTRLQRKQLYTAFSSKIHRRLQRTHCTAI